MSPNLTIAEENYIKSIYHLQQLHESVNTNALADHLKTKPASITDMLKKLQSKGLVQYNRYKGFKLSRDGNKAALIIIRRHRLWEVFLVEKLDFSWDEVHDIAEQLEHIKSEKLINKLDDFLGNPTEDPHGDPIPNAQGLLPKIEKQLLSDLAESQKGICVGVKDTSSEFLKYLDKQQIALGSTIEIISKETFDLSLRIKVDDKPLNISNKIASNLFVKLS